MSDNLKKEARKQYLYYFRIWFVIVGILLVLTIVMGIRYSMRAGCAYEYYGTDRACL